jgi:hypothetical protein
MCSQKSIMRNFTNCKIIMFKLQKHGFLKPVLGWNFIFLEFSIKMCLLLREVLVHLENILEKWGEYSPKNEKLKKTWFLYFKKINKYEWVCDERKNGIANKFQFFFNPNGGNVAERNSKSMQFSLLKIDKIEPANKV